MHQSVWLRQLNPCNREIAKNRREHLGMNETKTLTSLLLFFWWYKEMREKSRENDLLCFLSPSNIRRDDRSNRVSIGWSVGVYKSVVQLACSRVREIRASKTLSMCDLVSSFSLRLRPAKCAGLLLFCLSSSRSVIFEIFFSFHRCSYCCFVWEEGGRVNEQNDWEMRVWVNKRLIGSMTMLLVMICLFNRRMIYLPASCPYSLV